MNRKTKNWDNILTYDFLIEEYINKNKSYTIIAKEINCGIKRVVDKLKKYNINIKKRQVYYNKEEILTDINKTNIKMIGEYLGSHHKTKFLCHCGNEFITTPDKIKRKHTKSCGCLIRNNHSKNWKGYENIHGKYYTLLKRGAKIRNLEFDITIEDIWNQYIKQDKKCMLSGLEIEWYDKNNLGTASVDRINSSEGYLINNIQIIHKDINQMKMDLDQDKFINYCNMITKRSCSV